MRTVAIVQARMGSTRLPGKVLMDIGGETTLSRVVGRLSRSKLIDAIVIATTTSKADDAVAAEANRLGVGVFRGSENDVLSRYLQAAETFSADVIVRITSDCPLIDAGLVDETLQEFFNRRADFAFNDVPERLPRGLDVEVFTREALRRASHIADEQYQREHVTPMFYERPELFRVVALRSERNFSRYRWTLDTAEDLRLIRAIYAQFANGNEFTYGEIIDVMERSPELAEINGHIVQKNAHDVAPTHT